MSEVSKVTFGNLATVADVLAFLANKADWAHETLNDEDTDPRELDYFEGLHDAYGIAVIALEKVISEGDK